MKEGSVFVQHEVFVQFVLPDYTASALEINESKVVQAIILVLDESQATLVPAECPRVRIRMSIVYAGNSGHENLVVRGEDTLDLVLLIGIHRRAGGHGGRQ